MPVEPLYKYLQIAGLELRNSNLPKKENQGESPSRKENRVSASRNALVHGESRNWRGLESEICEIKREIRLIS
jgi:hypothetical protein